MKLVEQQKIHMYFFRIQDFFILCHNQIFICSLCYSYAIVILIVMQNYDIKTEEQNLKIHLEEYTVKLSLQYKLALRRSVYEEECIQPSSPKYLWIICSLRIDVKWTAGQNTSSPSEIAIRRTVDTAPITKIYMNCELSVHRWRMNWYPPILEFDCVSHIYILRMETTRTKSKFPLHYIESKMKGK